MHETTQWPTFRPMPLMVCLFRFLSLAPKDRFCAAECVMSRRVYNDPSKSSKVKVVDFAQIENVYMELPIGPE